jgi:hypothetical protein
MSAPDKRRAIIDRLSEGPPPPRGADFLDRMVVDAHQVKLARDRFLRAPLAEKRTTALAMLDYARERSEQLDREAMLKEHVERSAKGGAQRAVPPGGDAEKEELLERLAAARAQAEALGIDVEDEELDLDDEGSGQDTYEPWGWNVGGESEP